jgi:hypothetical protein
MDKSTIEIIANMVTILGFPATIFFVIMELKKGNKELKKSSTIVKGLVKTINQQNTTISTDAFVNKGQISNVNIVNNKKSVKIKTRSN